jgi:hypothetical protein
MRTQTKTIAKIEIEPRATHVALHSFLARRIARTDRRQKDQLKVVLRIPHYRALPDIRFVLPLQRVKACFQVTYVIKYRQSHEKHEPQYHNYSRGYRDYLRPHHLYHDCAARAHCSNPPWAGDPIQGTGTRIASLRS